MLYLQLFINKHFIWSCFRLWKVNLLKHLHWLLLMLLSVEYSIHLSILGFTFKVSISYHTITIYYYQACYILVLLLDINTYIKIILAARTDFAREKRNHIIWWKRMKIWAVVFDFNANRQTDKRDWELYFIICKDNKENSN